MAKSREDIDELMHQHQYGVLPDQKEEIVGEIIYILEFLFFYISVIFILITGISALVNLLTGVPFSFENIRDTAEPISAIGTMIMFFIFAMSYYAGMATFTGAMMVKAWTNSPGMDNNSAFIDMQRLMSGGELIKGTFIGLFVSFIFYYFLFDSIF